MRRFIFVLFLMFVATHVAIDAPTVDAQGWRLFSNKIKEDAQKKKTDASGEAAPEEEEEEEAPPLFDVTRKDREQEEIQTQEVPTFDAKEANEEERPQRDVRSSVSNGGMLDFSDALVDDAAELSGDADNEPQLFNDSPFAPSLPSYRKLKAQQNDARLNDVYFVDREIGWAVGDRGTIWNTLDGGQTWTLQETPTDANLFAVSFLDENYGLAVGGRVLPSARVGQGVALRTIDGGQTWGEIDLPSFPILRDVKIVDEENAWLAGDCSNLYPSGLFFSSDTGLEWTVVEGERRGSWQSALYDPIERLGVGVTTEGKIQTVDGPDAEERPLSLGTRRVKDVAYDGANSKAWVVGDQGLVLVSTDFGANWGQTPGGFLNESQNYFDLNAVAAKDGLVGAVGSPGSLFFYTLDGGNRWNAAPTGVSAPLRKVTFVDREYGWAVGDLGEIVATTDGGQTWRKQRSGADRVALLALFGRVQDAPLEAFVQLAGDEGFLTEVALLARESEREGLSEEIPYLERFNEALVETGASGVTQTSLFLLNPEERRDTIEQILQRFDAENDGDGLARFRERLVRLLRTWRPSCVVTIEAELDRGAGDVGKLPNNVDLTSADGAKALVGALVEDSKRIDRRPKDAFQELLIRELPGAIKNAADPTAFPEHMTACNLEPWTVLKARSLCSGKTQGNLSIDSAYFCAALGRPIAEIASSARAILDPAPEVKDATNFQTFFSAVPPKYADKLFFDGLNLPYGCDARREKQTELSQNADAYAARAGDRRQKLGVVDALSRRSSTARGSELLLSQLRSNIQGVDEDFAVEYLSTVGRQFAARGKLTAAEEAYSLAALQAPDNIKTREAFAWLAQYYSGSEPFRRVQTQGDETLDQTPYERFDNAKRLGETIRDVAPETYMAPEIRFPLAAAQAKQGDLQGAMRFYMNRSQSSSDDVWGARAAAEYWLRAPQSDLRAAESQYCPLGTFTCKRILGKPYLDGIFEPEIWDAAQKLDLAAPYLEAPIVRELSAAEKSAKRWREKNREFTTNLGTSVMFAYDSDYLYLAATCSKAPNFDYAAIAEASKSSLSEKLNAASGEVDAETPPRDRDADLTLSDRIELQFDLDGDYTTAYRFVFDCRGWAKDENWNDDSWDPELYVATAETNATWNLEVAIPLAELVERTPKAGDVWRAAVRRVTPGVGVQCWNVENSDSGENAFGIMNFE